MIFPLAGPALQIVLNGTPVPSYRPAVLVHGRVMAPVDPYLTALCASVETGATILTVRRGDRFTQAHLIGGYVEIAPVLRALGAQVTYDARTRSLLVRIADAQPFATPTPFNPAVPQVPPIAVFTPLPAPTDKPAVTGKPLPRRTPLPFSAASPPPHGNS